MYDTTARVLADTSHLAGGGWIEIAQAQAPDQAPARPTSQEVGGLKYHWKPYHGCHGVSHLAGGGWIEILDIDMITGQGIMSHLAGGGWIEMLYSNPIVLKPRPTSQEVGGLKCKVAYQNHH